MKNDVTPRRWRKTTTADRRGGVIAVLAALVSIVLAAATSAVVAAPLDSIGALVSSATAAAAAPRGDRAPVASRPAPADAALHLSGWSIGGDESHTVVTLDLSHAAPIRLFTTDMPTRVVVDLPAARFDGAGSGDRAGRGLVAAWRFGALTAHRSRLVLETRGAVRIVRAAFDPVAPDGRTRLVVELSPSSRAEMRRAAPIEIGAARSAAVSPAPPREATTAAAGRPVVVIDAGHGGVDAGTVSPATGTPEKKVVLEMARTLARRLRATGRYEVITTRDDDTFLALGERVRIARAHHADLFLSVHADAEYDHSVRGATVYTLAETASDEQAAALAAKENQSDAIAGHVVEEAEPEVADILADLTLRETRRLSHAFARDLLEEYRHHGRLVKSQPHRQAGLKVLRAHDIPSALVELGFLSNKEDEALLTSSEWQEKTAVSLVTAIDRYFAGRDAIATPLQSEPRAADR
jgi:N-acetylmuramoyl-L-alanine amidase